MIVKGGADSTMTVPAPRVLKLKSILPSANHGAMPVALAWKATQIYVSASSQDVCLLDAYEIKAPPQDCLH